MDNYLKPAQNYVLYVHIYAISVHIAYRMLFPYPPWKRSASAAGLTDRGMTDGASMALAMRSDNSWSTAAKTATKARKLELVVVEKVRLALPGFDTSILNIS